MRGSAAGLSGGHTYLCSYLEVLSWAGFSLLPVDLSASRPGGQRELPHMVALASRESETSNLQGLFTLWLRHHTMPFCHILLVKVSEGQP